MANTTNMIRLMTHAADLLYAVDPTPDYQRLIKEVPYSEAQKYAGRLRAVTAAIVNAETLLRMVAAAMDDETAAPAGTGQNQ